MVAVSWGMGRERAEEPPHCLRPIVSKKEERRKMAKKKAFMCREQK